MIRVERRPDESMEKFIRRFKRRCEKEGLVAEVRDRQYFIPPSLEKHHEEKRLKKRIAKENRLKLNK